MQSVKLRLIYKLLAIHVTVIAFVMAVVWLAIDTLAAGYFVTLMEKYHISPEPAHEMFVSAIHRYLIWACLAAVILALVLSYFLMRRVLAPLSRMIHITREIASGNFSVRVPEGGPDEIGQLARAFNRMARSLKEIENLRRALMIDVAHELRTPLTNIRGYLEALNDRILPPSAETLSLLQEETMRLVALVEDVLRLARADAAQKGLDLEIVDLNRLIQTALEPFDAAFSQRQVQVDLHLPTDPVAMHLDSNRMARVLRNLMDNAARYTPRGHRFIIELYVEADQACICFRNSALELTDADLPYLFERFYRGEKSRSRAHGGAGIGLAIVQELVMAHGGTVAANLKDRQLTIRLTLPINP